MEYQEIKPIKSKTTVNKYLNSKIAEEIIVGLIGATKGVKDIIWLQNKCLQLTSHSDYWVAKTAINCLSDIVRKAEIYDKNKILKTLSQIDNSELFGDIENFKEDLSIFE